MREQSKTETLKIETLELNKETLRDLVEENLADLVEDQAEGVRGGNGLGKFLGHCKIV